METRIESWVHGTSRRRVGTHRIRRIRRCVWSARAETGQPSGAALRVAKQFGYGVESVRSWVKQADIDDGIMSVDAARVKRLEQENDAATKTHESTPIKARLANVASSVTVVEIRTPCAR